MKKSDLKDGYKVYFKDSFVVEAHGIVRKDRVEYRQGYIKLSDYNDNFTFRHNIEGPDIVKVECPQCGVLWEREEGGVITLHGHPVKVGDKVFSVFNGWGSVKTIDHSLQYPIVVAFDNFGDKSFTKSGKIIEGHIYPSLGWSEEYDVRKLKDTKPKKLVKRWRWVYGNSFTRWAITANHYTEKGIIDWCDGMYDYQKIEKTEIEEEV